ncbi:hypothetical protein C8E97_6670 [Saccharothrix australiensis]|uniref:Uncharacterized protein n=1 Tax=Saccharothrix australiensis TaxID=2072 RepID=A0A495WDT0_9PSEU|nr:hypothetical protein C8E97_6670 [Saccharothrix australiensis]
MFHPVEPPPRVILCQVFSPGEYLTLPLRWVRLLSLTGAGLAFCALLEQQDHSRVSTAAG